MTVWWGVCALLPPSEVPAAVTEEPTKEAAAELCVLGALKSKHSPWGSS